MNRPKLTKKELASRADRFEEQLDRLKNRLNRYSYKKTKQSNRLDLLRENTQALKQRLDHLDRHLERLAGDGESLPAQWKKLQKQLRSLEKAVADLQSRGQSESTRLTSGLQDLEQRQQRLKSDLRLMRKVVKRISDGRDDLNRDSRELGKHIRNLEESSSKFAVQQKSHDSRIRELEETFSEASRQQEQQRRQAQQQAESERQAVQARIDALQSSLTQLQGEFAGSRGKQKESRQKLEVLANRLGDLGGELSRLQEDTEQRLQGTDTRLQRVGEHLPGLESRLERLEAAQTQESEAISALELNLEKSRQSGQALNQSLRALSEHVTRLEQQLDRMQATDARTEERAADLETRLRQLVDDLTNERSRITGVEQKLEHAGTELAQLRASLEQQLTENQATSEQQAQQIDGLAETTYTHAERLEALDAAIEATDQRAARDRQQAGEQIQRLDEAQAGFGERLKALESASGGQQKEITLLQAGLEQAGETDGRQEQRIEAAHNSGLRHSMAITVLLILGLLGGIALYQYLTQQIAGMKREMALSLSQQGERFVRREESDERYLQLQSALEETRRQLATPPAPARLLAVAGGEPASPELAARQARLEEGVARNRERIDALALAGGDTSQMATLQDLQQRLTAVEQSLTALGTELQQSLPARVPDDALIQRIVDAETSLTGLEQRLERLEQGQQAASQRQETLARRVEALDDTLTGLKEDVQLSRLPARAIRWRQAAELGQYSIQLLGMHRLRSLLRFAADHLTEGNAGAYALTRYQGRKWYILLYGRYDTPREARAALEALPETIRAESPWIRRLDPGLEITPLP